MCSEVIQMTTTLTARLDSSDKNEFEVFCKSVGMTPSTAINLFVKATIRNGELPFPIKADPFYSKANITRLKASIKEMESTGGTIHEIESDD